MVLTLFSKREDRRSCLAAPLLEGYWDYPLDEGRDPEGHLHVSGWIFSRDVAVSEVTATISRMPPVRLEYGILRPDVAAALGLKAAEPSGFRGALTLPRRGGWTVKIWATLRTGRRILCFRRYFRPRPSGSTLNRVRGKLLARLTREKTEPPYDPRQVLVNLDSTMLDHVLSSRADIHFPAATKPLVSVLVVVYNRAELVLRCIKCLAATPVPIELIIVDNCSSDATPRLLDRLRGTTIIRNRTNVGFLDGTNQAAATARGDFLLLLNSDAELLPGSLEAAIETLCGSHDIGAVTGKLIYPDGRLQEAGGIIWRDGSCQGYGRGDRPAAPEYMFRRDVDYGSGAFLLTRRSTFNDLGGFDRRFVPAYYEDADYCVRLWRSGKRVVYEPRAAVLHFEFASSSHHQAVRMQQDRQARFVEAHSEWLQTRSAPTPGADVLARSRYNGPCRLLIVDDRVPHHKLGSGFPRAAEILATGLELGYQITHYPLVVPDELWEDAYSDVPREIELMLGLGVAGLRRFLLDRANSFDAIMVSRPHNMRAVKPLLPRRSSHRPSLIYDAEAVFALRDIGRRRLTGEKISDPLAARMVATELTLAAGSDLVITVSEAERAHFSRAGFQNVTVLGHAVSAQPTPRTFRDRDGLLFVGAVPDDTAPNADSLSWFVHDILPDLRSRLNEHVLLRVAGRNASRKVASLSDPSLVMLGMVDDVTPLFDQARVFIAPTRYGAGIPFKAHQAAALGVPIVCTSLIADQLGWRDREDLLVADDPADYAECCLALYRDESLWQHIRQSALARVKRECSPDGFRSALAEAVNTTISS